MRLLRSGTDRFHGWTTIIDNRNAQIAFDSDNKELIVRAWGIPDIHQDMGYDWDMHLSLDDVTKIIDMAANGVFAAYPNDLHRALSDTAVALLKLLMCSAGYPPPDKLGNQEGAAEKQV